MHKIIGIILCFGMLVGCDLITEEKPKENIADVFEKDNCYRYYFETLSKKEQKVYKEIYTALSDRVKEVEVATANDKTISKILECVINDHPEIYYCDKYSYSVGTESSDISFDYKVTKKQIRKYNQQLEKTSNDFINGIDANASDFDKVKLAYDFLIERCDYLEGAKFNQDIRSSLVLNTTVCAGYARGMSYLLNKMNIDAACIIGEIKNPEENQNRAHAWNMVILDGNVYYLDATWGDNVELGPHTCYSFLLMSEEEMLANYTPNVKTLPSNTSDNNYFVKMDQYIDSYDEAKISTIIGNAIANGSNVVELKCSPDAYDSILYQLFDNERIFNLLMAYTIDSNNIIYSERRSVNVIEIKL